MGARARRLSSVLSPVLAVVLILTLVTSADATTATSAWRATIGSGGANGSATITAYTTGTGSVVLKLAKMRASTYLPVTLSKGTCSSVGTTLIRFPTIKSTSSGTAARTSSLTASQVTVIKSAATGTGKIAIRVGSSATGGIKCGLFAALAVPPYVAARVTVGSEPEGVTITPNGVLVANYYESTLTRVDPSTNSVLASLPVEATGWAGPGALAYGDGAVWVTVPAYDDSGQNAIASSVERLDPASGAVAATIPVGRGPWAITTSPGAVWVANFDDGTVSRIDPATNAVVATITLSAGIVDFSFGFGSLWVANDRTGSVSRIDPATNQVTATIPTVGGAEGVATGAGAVWVANWGTTGQADGALSRIDPATNAVVRVIPVGTNPNEVAFAGGSVWIAMRGEPTVVRVDAATNAVSARVSTGAKVLDSSGRVVGSRGIAASDHAVWVVRPLPYPGNDTTPWAGSVVRINY